MLINITCEKRFEECRAYSMKEKKNFEETFFQLLAIAGGGEDLLLTISEDFAPMSMVWAVSDVSRTKWGLHGGLIYHSSANEWSIHT